MSLLTDIKFNQKEGTHTTLSKVMFELNGMASIDVTGVEDPVARLTIDIGDYVWVKSVESNVIWLVAPLSTIQGLVKTKLEFNNC